MNEWGRDDRAGYWPPRMPQASLLAVLAGIGVMVGCLVLQPRTPLQRYYLTAYVGSSTAAAVGLPALRYTLLDVAGRVGSQPAVDADMAALVGDGFVLSTSARSLGFNRVIANKDRHDNAKMRDWFQRVIFVESVSRMLLWPALAGAVTLLCAMYVAIPADRQRARERRRGRRMAGPEMPAPEQFSIAVQGDGIVLPQTRPIFLGLGSRRAPAVILPSEADVNHIMIVGDSGTGKTTLIDEILERSDRIGETAVVYDPKNHFARKWFRQERGDVLLNPTHVGCPYWPIGEEVQHESEALGIATALFPSRPHESNPFFPDSARAIVARMLEFRPSVHELVGWLSNRHYVLQLCKADPTLVDDASLEDIMAEDAPAQKSGVMASLNLAAAALRMCPRDESGGVWSAYRWAQRRHGWIFICNTPTTRDRLKQLQSLWLDMIIRRMMDGTLASHPVKIIADELPTLDRLPIMATVVAEGRQSNLSVVLGFQAKQQLQERYGKDADAMISGCRTAIILRQNDDVSAESFSKKIGDIKIERIKESRSNGLFRSKSTQLSLERSVERLVMPSELSGLDNMRGFLKYGNLVTPLRFRHKARPDRCEGIIPKAPLPARVVPDLTLTPQHIGPNPKPKKTGGQVRFTSPKRQPVHEEG